ncbi:hypothetical protein [Caulobacter sp. UC70_42]|uniref:hypothetical protein n=1 Tax=Caulobacter sp. UC70_42 TaxID=3374551 RepID=UPI003756BCF4
MDLEQLKQVLLGTVDDDWYGLWEIDWAFNSAGVPADFRMRSGALKALVQQGAVELWFGLPWSGERIEFELALQAISIPSNWEPRTSREQHYYFVGIRD